MSMAPRCSRDELINLSLAEIDPPEERKDACPLEIQEALKIIDRVRVIDEAPRPSEFKKRDGSLY